MIFVHVHRPENNGKSFQSMGIGLKTMGNHFNALAYAGKQWENISVHGHRPENNVK